MSKNDIITEIYKKNLIEKLTNNFISKIGAYKEDFRQHLYLILCNIDEEKLIGLYERKELEYYLYYIAKAQVFNERSDFWKEHKGFLTIDHSLDDENYKEKNTENFD